MNPIPIFAGIHWPSVLVASIASFAVGGLWYSPFFLGKAWAAEHPLTKKNIGPADMAVIFGTTFILTFIGAVVLDLFIGRNGTLLTGVVTGLLIGVFFIAGSFGINYLFARKSRKLFLIDAWYFVVLYIVMGAILGAW
jgi:hypothetical protein